MCLALGQVLHIHYFIRKFAVEEAAAQTDEMICLDHIAQIEVEFELRQDVCPSMLFSSMYHTQVFGDYSSISNEKPLKDFKLPCNMIRFAFLKDLSGSYVQEELSHTELEDQLGSSYRDPSQKKNESLGQQSQVVVHCNYIRN